MASITHTDRTRLLTGVAAAAFWAVLLLQLYLHIQFSFSVGSGVAFGFVIYFGFFTILTNLLVALALTMPIVAPTSRLGRFFSRDTTVTGVTASIIVVGVAFAVLLAPYFDVQGLDLFVNVFLHYVTPVVFVVYWWALVPKHELQLVDVLGWTLYPLGYLLYTFVRGELIGIYPYPFLDVNELGYASAVLGGLGVAAGFVVCTLVLYAVSRVQGRRVRGRGASQ